MSIQSMREQRAAKAKELQDLVNKAEWKADVDQPIYDAGMATIDEIDGKIKRIEEVNARLAEDTRTNEVANHAEKRGKDEKNAGLKVYAKWLRGGDAALNQEDWQVVRNTMSTTTPSQGGYTVAAEVAATVIDALKAYGGMREVSTVFATSGVGSISFPTSDGTAETGEIIAENVTATAADVVFGTVGVPVWKFSSKVVAVPFELLQDSSIDVEAFVQDRLVARLGRITNQMFTTGTGSSQPNGIVTAAAVGYTAANSTSQVTAVKYDSLIEIQHSLDPSYRRNAGWMFNDSTLKILRQLKDGNSRPIFVPGYETGMPGGSSDMLLGAPVTINQDMASMAAAAKSMLYGDFATYNIRDVMAVEMFRFTDSAYTKLGQVGFLAWMRTGGNLLDVSAVKAFVNATI